MSPSTTAPLPSRPHKPESVSAFDTTSADPQKYHPSRKHSIAPALADRVDRTSFSSIKESNTGVAQSFTSSKTSSLERGSEEAIDDGTTTPLEKVVGEDRMLNPQSSLHGLICPCDSFRGWKNISIGGKVASKSFGDLRRLASRWDWQANDELARK